MLKPDTTYDRAPKKLSDLLAEVRVTRVVGEADVLIHGIRTDSREGRPMDMFVAVRGTSVDGHSYVRQAIETGASSVVVARDRYEQELRSWLQPGYLEQYNTTVIVVDDTHTALVAFADAFYDNPGSSLRLSGITGTNGKTTSSYLLRSIIHASGNNAGLIGTVEYCIGDSSYPSQLTTPDPVQLRMLLARMRDAGCSDVVMEVSSHALDQGRVDGLTYEVSVFTNLTQDHLDYHQTRTRYLEAKRRLFTEYTTGTAVLNFDDPATETLRAGLDIPVVGYGFSPEADVRISRLSISETGNAIHLEALGNEVDISSPLIGRFNAYNVAAAFAAGLMLDIPSLDIVRGIESLSRVPGRFDRVTSPDGVSVFIDYSHTPDALKNALLTLREIRDTLHPGAKIITVFGCGGDRDREKRPAMGAIATELSDLVLVTSDNPRTEDPDAIIADILGGIHDRSNVMIDRDRRAAIRTAIQRARPGDLVLVAGKGHEDYQILGAERIHFSDHEVVQEAFEQRENGS
ncbi:MAG: UDP-N-acetylmuramoyl-L-alanyl-D-glutamate--2,6-diaminopimelate ligase [Chlorobi bacterium]|nr:UDP-N-acetylmuramoyl-L-alanyl-D-glutamate--2,6-diaminopimelate ligase [Chlorobiota bacterium]